MSTLETPAPAARRGAVAGAGSNTAREQHRVGGTLFAWPELPSSDVIGPSAHAHFRAEREAVLRAAGARPRRTCSTVAKPHGSAHSCSDPAGCSVAHLIGRPPTWSGALRPGQRVHWEQDVSDSSCRELVARSGEIWDRAAGNNYWVVPDMPLDEDRVWGLPRVHARDLQRAAR